MGEQVWVVKMASEGYVINMGKELDPIREIWEPVFPSEE